MNRGSGSVPGRMPNVVQTIPRRLPSKIGADTENGRSVRHGRASVWSEQRVSRIAARSVLR